MTFICLILNLQGCKHKNYVFYNQIITDGFSCSLLFILKKYKNKEFGDRLPTVNDEVELIKLNNLTKKQCDEYLTDKYKLVYCDPGKIRPISMIDDNNNFYKYTACRRRNDTYTKRSNQILLSEKIKNNIIPIETELSKYKSRTTNIKNYKEFITKKTETNKKLFPFYNNKLFRKLAFRRFVKTKQSEEKLLNEIENKYLTNNNKKELVIFMGDYSRTTQMKGTIPTFNIGLKKLLLKRFKLIEVNEYNTSKLYNKTLKELVNVKIRKRKHVKHLHEILTPKEETEKRIYVNRDVNACKNIRLITKTYLCEMKRPIEFTRVIKPKEKVKRKAHKNKEIVV